MTTKRELLRMARQFCSECMGGPRATENVWPVTNPGEIVDCTAPECIWFEFRFGKDPRPMKRELTEKQLEALAKGRKHSG